MKTTPLFNAAKIFSLASLVFFTACSEGEDPAPIDPNAQDTTITTGLPGGGGNNGGGLPGGGGNPGGGLPGGGTGGNGGGGNGPLGGGGNQPANDSNIIGTLTAGGQQYNYTNFGSAGEAQSDGNGTYPVYLGYSDEVSDAEGDFELFDEGNTAFIYYNASEPGTIETGDYELGNAPFSAIFFGIQGFGYLLNEGTISVEATQSAGQLLITIEGYVVEVEQQADGSLAQVSEDSIPIEAQFAALSQVDTNARTAGFAITQKTISRWKK